MWVLKKTVHGRDAIKKLDFIDKYTWERKYFEPSSGSFTMQTGMVSVIKSPAANNSNTLFNSLGPTFMIMNLLASNTF